MSAVVMVRHFFDRYKGRTFIGSNAIHIWPLRYYL